MSPIAYSIHTAKLSIKKNFNKNHNRYARLTLKTFTIEAYLQTW
jgi:hypothetical protein